MISKLNFSPLVRNRNHSVQDFMIGSEKKSDDFVASIIQSAREGTDVKGLYFQNDAESIHFLEKLSQEFNK